MKAKDWATKTWQKAEKDWINRKQDLNYREYLIHPALEEQVNDVGSRNGILVDLGCGDGTETLFLKQVLGRVGFDKFYGFDHNQSFIKKAQENNAQSTNIIFDSGELTGLSDKYKLQGHTDLATSLFVLQDEPEYEELIKVMHSYLRMDGSFLALTVHPQFSEWLLEKGALSINPDLYKSEKNNYEFAGNYPIVEPGRPPFFVPYFHRELSDYIKVLENYFYIDSIKGLKPSKQVLALAEIEKISPFYNEKHNVYWPKIAEHPSSVMIKGIKK
jgi:SAM-dependent methyltransferase